MARRARSLVAGSASVGVLVSTAVIFSPLTDVASATVSAIPANYFTVVDPVADDEPNQKDLSQMGRDDSSATRLKVFWSWDDTSFTAQTGDACALFSATADGHVTFAICGEVENGAGATVVLTSGYPVGFTCTPAAHPLDRCDSSTAASIGTTTAGPIGGVGTDLVTATDPHHAGGSDTTLAVDIQRSVLPAGADLVNVCSYPSAGNGANNDPSDCIVTPGAGFLNIVKNTTGGNGTFDFTIDPGTVAKSITTAAGTGTSSVLTAAHGTDFSVAETVPSTWLLTGATCALQGNTATGTFDAATSKVTSITVEVGRLTTCTFSDAAAAPALTLDKQSTTGSYDSVGDQISYTYDLTNSGNVPLKPPYSVTDDKATVTCPQTPDPLTLNGSLQCTATYTVTQADIDAGSVTNLANGHAFYGTQPVTSNQDSVTVNAAQNPELTLDKDSPDLDYDHVGQVVSYTYDLTNSGNVTLSAPYTVTDDLIASVSCPAIPATLAPGDGVQCTASYTVKQSDLDAGAITNHAKGHAFFGNTVVDSNPDTVTINAAQDASLHLDKAVTEASYDHVGQVLHYTYTLTNDGNVTLTSPYDVDDDLINDAHIDCTAGPATLAPLGHFDCTGTYAVTQTDLDAGSITNHATATATFNQADVTSNQDEVTIDADQAPELTLVKTANTVNYDAVGDTLSYGYRLTNSGNVTLSAPYTVDDDLIATVTCPAIPLTIAPGAHVDCTGSYQTIQADLDAGSVTNHATGHANFGRTVVDSNQDDATVPAVQNPGLTLVKDNVDTSYVAVGDVLDYTYTLTNSGNVTLTGPYAVDDDLIATVDCTLGPATLAPGDAFQCTGSYTVTQADLDAGDVINNATASATFGNTTVVSNPDDATVPAVQNPDLSLVKNVAEASYDTAGDSLHYTYTLTNVGNVTLSKPYAVDDDKIAAVDCPTSPAKLAPGDTVDCTATYSVAQADVDAGDVTNHAIASAAFGNTVVVSNQDEATVPAIQDPAFDLVKAVDKKKAQYGDTLTYTLTLTNVGNLSLTGVVVGDDVPDGTTYVEGSASPKGIASYNAGKHSVSWAVGDLAVGEIVDNLTFQVTIDTPSFDPVDGLPPTTIDNVAVVRGDQVEEQPSNHVKTPVITVLGVKVVRRPPKELPFTGAALPPQLSVAVALLMISAGMLLVAGRRRRRT